MNGIKEVTAVPDKQCDGNGTIWVPVLKLGRIASDPIRCPGCPACRSKQEKAQ